MTATQNIWVASDRTIANIAGRQKEMKSCFVVQKKDFGERSSLFPAVFLEMDLGYVDIREA